MKKVLEDGKAYILRFDRGEEVITGLIAFARTTGIRAGTFQGIGAAAKITLSFYDLEKKTYCDTEFRDMEIASLMGNLGIIKGEYAVHAHGVFSGKDMAARAGHVKEIVISGTGEIRFEILEGELERLPDSGTGLNLLI